MELLQLQFLFSQSVSELIAKAKEIGNQVTLGEAWRSPETCSLYAKEGKGVANSNHMNRLAIDLNLFVDGKYKNSLEDYRELGEWWKSQTTPDVTYCWGGDFSSPDMDHFSFEFNGVR